MSKNKLSGLIKTNTICEYLAEGAKKKYNCLAVEFMVPENISGGTTYNNVFVNGRLIIPGESFSISQGDGYVDTCQYDIVFSGANTSALYVTYVVPDNGYIDIEEGE